MALRDPVVVYGPSDNSEAHLIQLFLEEASVEAFVVEDISEVGSTLLGPLPGINRPQVYVERADAARARSLLIEFERARQERSDPRSAANADLPPVVVLCDECGRRTSFPAGLRAQVQACPHCASYLDVEDDGEPAG